jgi:hypothetical protein
MLVPSKLELTPVEKRPSWAPATYLLEIWRRVCILFETLATHLIFHTKYNALDVINTKNEASWNLTISTVEPISLKHTHHELNIRFFERRLLCRRTAYLNLLLTFIADSYDVHQGHVITYICGWGPLLLSTELVSQLPELLTTLSASSPKTFYEGNIWSWNWNQKLN